MRPERGGPGRDAATRFALGLIAAGLGLCGLLWVAVAAGAAAAGQPGPGSVLALPLELTRHRRAWPGRVSDAVAAAELLLLAAVAVALARRGGLGLTGSRRRARRRVDAAARLMGRESDLWPLTAAGIRDSARRLSGVESGDARRNGVLLGRSVPGGAALHASLEDTMAAIWGPRTGKTTSLVIPMVLAAPGPVLTTSNRRDVLDATRLPRSRCGRVWVFDPQAVAGEEPSWWWDPLETVTSVTEARRLAGHFAAASRAPDARRDAFFDPAGEDLLANLLLAAAAAGATVLTVYGWLTDPVDRTPQRELEAAGQLLPAQSVAGVIGSPEKLRGSVYATAMQMASCLIEPSVTRWVTPPARPLPQLHPEEFVTAAAGRGEAGDTGDVSVGGVDEDGRGGVDVGGDTLYALSREGEGTAAPLVTALCAAVLEAAERQAARCARGRLPVPLLAPLDEVANVCRIRALPDLFSHYGGRGILLLAVLQSWSQGVEVWGEKGMAKLWSAANVRTYGGGVSEPAFLDALSRLIGDRDVPTRSTSWTRGTRSTSYAARRDRVLDVAALGALPRGRAVLLASGLPPAVLEPVPWQSGPHAAAVRESLARHDPGARVGDRPQPQGRRTAHSRPSTVERSR